MKELTSAEKRQLKAAAHNLKPAVFIGKDGITGSLLKSFFDAIAANELIKVKFVANKEEKESLVEALCEKSQSNLVGLIGHVAIIYRANPDPTKAKIRLF